MWELIWSAISVEEAAFSDVEGDDAVGVLLWVIEVGEAGYHDGFEGVGDDLCETSP